MTLGCSDPNGAAGGRGDRLGPTGSCGGAGRDQCWLPAVPPALPLLFSRVMHFFFLPVMFFQPLLPAQGAQPRLLCHLLTKDRWLHGPATPQHPAPSTAQPASTHLLPSSTPQLPPSLPSPLMQPPDLKASPGIQINPRKSKDEKIPLLWSSPLQPEQQKRMGKGCTQLPSDRSSPGKRVEAGRV